MNRIVVGIDGSPESSAALRWAVAEAQLGNAEIEAVHVYEDANDSGLATRVDEGAGEGVLRTVRAEHARAEQRAQTLVDEVLAEIRDVGSVSISSQIVADPRPARALINASRDADVLVVGTRGRGGLSGLVLGSVSQDCAQSAECPVLIHRTPRTDG